MTAAATRRKSRALFSLRAPVCSYATLQIDFIQGTNGHGLFIGRGPIGEVPVLVYVKLKELFVHLPLSDRRKDEGLGAAAVAADDVLVGVGKAADAAPHAGGTIAVGIKIRAEKFFQLVLFFFGDDGHGKERFLSAVVVVAGAVVEMDFRNADPHAPSRVVALV